MGTGDTVTLTLEGGAPWGFRLQGGGPHPLKVSKIRKKSKAHVQNMQEGNTVVSVNGIPVSGRSHDEVMRMVDQSGEVLAIELYKGNMPDVFTQPGSYAPVINGHTSVQQDGNRTTTTTSSNYDDGTTRGSVHTQQYQEQGEGRQVRGFVRTEQMTSRVQDQWAPTQTPLPSLLDSSLSKQPYSAQPVQVQVSAMFSGPKSGVSDSSPSQGQSSPGNAPVFNVRKVTSQSSSTKTTKQELWEPGLDFRKDSLQGHYLANKPAPNSDSNYPTFPVPEVKKWKPSANQAPPTPPKPKQPPVPAPKPKVRDFKTELMSPRSYDDNVDYDVDRIIAPTDEHLTPAKHHHHHHAPVFAPPVQISLHAGERDDLSDRPSDLDLCRTMSLDSEISSPTSSMGGKKKLFGDSAFYDDPEKNFPTIQDQMKLCKIIAHSLTAAANKKARGAKMFAKRQRKAERWVHDGQTRIFGEQDDIPGFNPDYYDEDPEDRFNLSFKIPSVKQRVTSPDTDQKMSLSQQEFERMRLEAQRCDHSNVSPNQCFDLAQSLKNSKGKAGNMFEKRRQRAEKYVVDESNARKAPVRPGGRLGMMKPLKGNLTPWEAALGDPTGNVDRAFDELSEFERKQKLNQMLKLKPAAPPAPAPRPATPPLVIPPNIKHSSLKADPLQLLKGQDFNRKARGWTGFGDSAQQSHSPRSISGSSSPVPQYQPQPQQPQNLTPQFRDFNPKPRAWRTSGEFEPMQGYNSPYASDSSNMLSPSGYHSQSSWGQPAMEMPGTDL